VQVRLGEFVLRRPRQWGACWVGCRLWDQLKLEEFWRDRLPDSREGTCWRHGLQTLTVYRLIDPGSEWRLHRQWFANSAMVATDGPEESQPIAPPNFRFELRKDKPRQVRRREGRYLLRSNLSAQEPEKLWQFYIQLTQVEAAFKDLKDDLALRPIFHPLEERIEAHIFVSFLAYCLHAHLRAHLKPLGAGPDAARRPG